MHKLLGDSINNKLAEELQRVICAMQETPSRLLPLKALAVRAVVVFRRRTDFGGKFILIILTFLGEWDRKNRIV
jgi:hypothetical protein